jgi:hypothetical protein
MILILKRLQDLLPDNATLVILDYTSLKWDNMTHEDALLLIKVIINNCTFFGILGLAFLVVKIVKK